MKSNPLDIFTRALTILFGMLGFLSLILMACARYPFNHAYVIALAVTAAGLYFGTKPLNDNDSTERHTH